MQHVMIDLETMGLRPDAAIISIGACHFDAESVKAQFECAVGLVSCIESGLTTDPGTVEWWSKQSAEARSHWQRADAPSLETAMTQFNIWLLGLSKPEDLCPWGNGADFDITILKSAYEALAADPPWKFYNVKCFRTMKTMHPVGDMPRHGLHHRSVDDAIHQAKHLQRILAVHKIVLP